MTTQPDGLAVAAKLLLLAVAALLVIVVASQVNKWAWDSQPTHDYGPSEETCNDEAKYNSYRSDLASKYGQDHVDSMDQCL